MLNKIQLELFHLHLPLIFLLYSPGVCISLFRLSFILQTSLTTSEREVFLACRGGLPVPFNHVVPTCNHTVTLGLVSALCSLPQKSGFQFPKSQVPCLGNDRWKQTLPRVLYPLVLHIRNGFKWGDGRVPFPRLKGGSVPATSRITSLHLCGLCAVLHLCLKNIK